ncbi:MAG TPA: IclR family transcriptional regulator [Candidatus Dormibacteraeota bacterium]|nr:IclR family transcriptional regulator [Candidatus Dormibacteraeota bacterium]
MKLISNNENHGLRTAVRALSVLEWIASQRSEPSAKEVAAALDLNLTTCYHLINTLLARGYLVKGEHRRLRLGPKVAFLYQSFARTLQPARDLLPILQGLSRATDETAYLAGWERGDVVLQAVVEGPHALRVTGLYPGLRGAAHARASGKAVLAYLSRGELETFLAEHPLTPLTASTITDPARLRDALGAVARDGVAVDREEFAVGICCVAAPFFGVDGTVKGALTVSMPASRFAASQDLCRKAVRSAGEQASRMLGYGGEYPPTTAATGADDGRRAVLGGDGR